MAKPGTQLHGTTAMYQRGCRCEPCRAAQAFWKHESMALRKYRRDRENKRDSRYVDPKVMLRQCKSLTCNSHPLHQAVINADHTGYLPRCGYLRPTGLPYVVLSVPGMIEEELGLQCKRCKTVERREAEVFGIK